MSYGFNGNGNITARGGDTFSYHQANRLVRVIPGLQSQAAELHALTNHTTNSSYSYDGDRLRVSKTAGTTTEYTWDIVSTPATEKKARLASVTWSTGRV